MSPEPGDSTSVWKISHFPWGDQRTLYKFTFSRSCTCALPPARWVHRSVPPVGLSQNVVAGLEENVTDLPSAVHAGIRLSFVSTVNLKLGPRSSLLIQILEGDCTLAICVWAIRFPSGEIVGSPM